MVVVVVVVEEVGRAVVAGAVAGVGVGVADAANAGGKQKTAGPEGWPAVRR